MAPHRKFSELEAKISPEVRARARKKAEALLAAMELDELVRARGMTQEQLAERLGKKQPNISRTLRRLDMHVSTLREVIEALDGQLEIIARFPEGDVHLTQFDAA